MLEPTLPSHGKHQVMAVLGGSRGNRGCVVLSLPWKLGILGPQAVPVSGQTLRTVWGRSSGPAGVGVSGAQVSFRKVGARGPHQVTG